MVATNYSYGIERDEETLKRNDLDHTKWTNPLESRYVTYLQSRADEWFT
jgi:phospholipid:diacylglycerol acyltransferase